jgi:hypothetical protein
LIADLIEESIGGDGEKASLELFFDNVDDFLPVVESLAYNRLFIRL